MPGQRRTPDHNVAIALEITGGHSTFALVDRHGGIHRHSQARTLRGRPLVATLEPFLRAIDELLLHAEEQGWHVNGLGVSLPGTLDAAARRLCIVPILPSLNDLPLRDLLETRYQLPVRLWTDADAALLGEYYAGVGKGHGRLLYLTLNAVVGAAFAVDGEIHQSAQAYTGHVAHLPIANSGPRCSCGRRGCINSLLSLEAIQKMAQRALQRNEETSLLRSLVQRGSFSPRLLAEEAMSGDAVALRIYEDIGRWLGAAVARYTSIFQPDALILGGSVLSANEVLFASIQSTLTMHVSTITERPVKIALACLGSNAALIGATVSFFQQDGQSSHKTEASSLYSVLPPPP